MGLVFSRQSSRHTLKDQKKLYELLRRFQAPTADDVWPIAPIMLYVREGYPVVMPKSLQQSLAENVTRDRSAGNYLSTTVDNSLQFAGPVELADLAQSYPNEDLGKRAQEKLNALNGKMGEQLAADIQLEPASPATTQTVVALDTELRPEPQPTPVQASVGEGPDSKVSEPPHSLNRLFLVLLAVVAGLAGVGLLMGFLRRKRTSCR